MGNGVKGMFEDEICAHPGCNLQGLKSADVYANVPAQKCVGAYHDNDERLFNGSAFKCEAEHLVCESCCWKGMEDRGAEETTQNYQNVRSALEADPDHQLLLINALRLDKLERSGG